MAKGAPQRGDETGANARAEKPPGRDDQQPSPEQGKVQRLRRVWEESEELRNGPRNEGMEKMTSIPRLRSSELKGMITGTLLGDSKIERNGKVFSSKQISRDLVQFKHDVLAGHFRDVRLQTHPAHHCGKWFHQELYEVRVRDEYFRKMYPDFYGEDGRKYVTMERLKCLTTLGLALWFADDGCTALIGVKSGRIRSRRVMLCTESFNVEEHETIRKYFRLYHGLDARVVGRDNGSGTEKRKRICFTTESAQVFIASIGGYFVDHFPSMLYKLDLGYQPDSMSSRTGRNVIVKEYWDFFNERVKTHGQFVDRLAREGAN